MKVLVWILATAAAVLAVGAAAFLIAGPERAWRVVAGDPDLGPVDFSDIARPASDNTFLVCPRGGCGSAAPDLVSPVYGVAPERLAAALRDLVEETGRAVRVDDGSDDRRARYVVRTPTMGFPDTVSIEAMPAAGGAAGEPESGAERSAIAIYSRSQLGRSDLGANARRVRSLLEGLSERLPVVRPAADGTG